MRNRAKILRLPVPAIALVLVLAGCHPSPSIPLEDNRLRVDASINGRPVQLVFDTGADDAVLLRASAEKLGLKITEPPANAVLKPGQVPTGLTPVCRVDLLNTSYDGTFRVFDAPPGPHPDFDGLLGWQNLRKNVLVFDLAHGRVNFAHSLPADVGAWPSLPMLKDQPVLGLAAAPAGAPAQSVMIDTGDTGGVALAPTRWRAWRAAHPRAPATLTAYYMPGAGIVVSEECWAEEVTLGLITLRNVPVTEASNAQVELSGPDFAGVIGLYGLSRMELVTDGIWSVAYFHALDTPARPYEHNRLGAVFVPKDLSGGPLRARVLPGTPADEAGIRDGDVLLRVDDYDATHWRDPDSKFPGNVFWEKPAGTKLDLTLERDGKEIHATVVLQDLIGPGPDHGTPQH